MTQRRLYAEKFVPADHPDPPPHLRRGLQWLDEHFTLDEEAIGSNFFYYMWTVQRVGEATGRRIFNGIDWYHAATARLLNRQRPDGTWRGPKGRMLSTGFALLYLARADDPVAIAKLRFDGAWNKRPHDLLHFVQWASDAYEVPMTWQVARPTTPLRRLLQSRMLYLSTDGSFQLGRSAVERLRKYVEYGGMLLLAPEGDRRAEFHSSAERLVGRLWDGAAFEKVPREHGLYDIHFELDYRGNLAMVHNGVRPLVLLHDKDLSRQLQANETGEPGAFRLLSNLYVYVTGRSLDRPRLKTAYIPRPEEEPNRTAAIARVRHSGRDAAEPAALRRLTRFLGRLHKLGVRRSAVRPGALDDAALAVCSLVDGSGSFSEEDVTALADYARGGGALWIDATGGSLAATKAAKALFHRVAEKAGWSEETLSDPHPIVTGEGLPGGHDNREVGYRLFIRSRTGHLSHPRLMIAEDEAGGFVVLSPEDTVAGLAGVRHWGIHGYEPESAMRLVSNTLLYSHQKQGGDGE